MPKHPLACGKHISYSSYNTEDGRSSRLIGHNVHLPVMHHLQRHEISGQRRATAIECWSPGSAPLSELIPEEEEDEEVTIPPSNSLP